MGKQAYTAARKFNITAEAYLAIQAAGCRICERADQVLAIDHDHTCCPGVTSCGKCARGGLCTSCNKGLGFFEDNPERLLAAVKYLTANAEVALL